MDFLKDTLSAVAGIPQIKLFGEQSKGLGGQSAGNIRLYYDDISEKQNDKLRAQMERLTSLVIKAQDYKSRFKKNLVTGDDWELKFNRLWQMTEKEAAETRKLQAQTDDLYLQNGVLTQSEVADSRFGGDSYSTDTKIMEEGNKKRKEGLVPVASRKTDETSDPSKGDDTDGDNAKSGSSGPT